jgi:hypothetical protein
MKFTHKPNLTKEKSRGINVKRNGTLTEDKKKINGIHTGNGED